VADLSNYILVVAELARVLDPERDVRMGECDAGIVTSPTGLSIYHMFIITQYFASSNVVSKDPKLLYLVSTRHTCE
jgi:hypothetical protein